ncbi:hypothetical protein E4T56_gene20390 [Termitomyces sp. T112]|nr:hypothetical protein E4T56_gene20390 [Termitomyces sp. T112]
MASILPIFLVFAVVAGLMALATLFTPKGPHQIVIRTSLLIGLVACYLLWMVTYLAQLHPLIAPQYTYLYN